ncbi:MAG TPA: hypothetical protein VIV66_09225, partial [Pyrinomonadaceae bacterium]
LEQRAWCLYSFVKKIDADEERYWTEPLGRTAKLSSQEGTAAARSRHERPKSRQVQQLPTKAI